MELPHASIPAPSLAQLTVDATLPVCTTCATQYPAPREDCPICEDPRQWVPEEGTTFTTLGEITAKSKNTLLKDPEDERIVFIQTVPHFGIGQTPILIQTEAGSYIWDCCALISPPLIAYLLALEKPLKGIAISHPHFYSTSLTWSRALNVPLYLNGADEEWYQRRESVKPEDKVVFWRERVRLGPNVELFECGGHFPGSSVLFWDRPAETPTRPADAAAAEPPRALPGVLLVADTVMVQPTRKGFTFMWSYPNMIPLDPASVLRIQRTLSSIPYDAATSTWPGRFIRAGAKRMLDDSVRSYLGWIGWEQRGGAGEGEGEGAGETKAGGEDKVEAEGKEGGKAVAGAGQTQGESDGAAGEAAGGGEGDAGPDGQGKGRDLGLRPLLK